MTKENNIKSNYQSNSNKNSLFTSDQKFKLLVESVLKNLTDFGVVDHDCTVKPVLKKNPDAMIFQIGTKGIPNNINMAAKIEKVVKKTKESNSKK